MKRSARGVLLALPLLLIGVGVVVAQESDESPAVAESITSVASAAPQVKSAPAVPSVKPAIAMPPTGGGDDEEGYEDEGYDD